MFQISNEVAFWSVFLASHYKVLPQKNITLERNITNFYPSHTCTELNSNFSKTLYCHIKLLVFHIQIITTGFWYSAQMVLQRAKVLILTSISWTLTSVQAVVSSTLVLWIIQQKNTSEIFINPYASWVLQIFCPPCYKIITVLCQDHTYLSTRG